jgi:hypothetical protein
MPENGIADELMVLGKTSNQQSEEIVLEIFRLHGGEVNVDQLAETSQIKYLSALAAVRRLCKQGAVVRTFYATRYALTTS